MRMRSRHAGDATGAAAAPFRPAAALLAFLAATAAVAGPVRQSFDLAVLQPPVPVTVDGAIRLVYELHLASYADTPLVLQQVEVLDADAGTVIADFANDELAHRVHVPAAVAGSRTLGGGTFGVMYLELELKNGKPPRALDHRLRFGVAGENPEMVTVGSGPVPLQNESPVALSPPLRGGPWAAVYDPAWTRGHRRVIYAVNGHAKIPGRFAIDWIKLDTDGHLARGDEDKVANWYGYGADVLAVANGVIAATRDDVAESATVSGHPDHSLGDATGNYIALDLGNGRFAFYEHLQPGGIRVEPGERVSSGQVIASLGFTGDSTGPHLHFHVADANSPLDAEGIPFVLDQFTVLGTYDEFERLGSAPWTPLDGTNGGERTAELPASNVVIEFPAREGQLASASTPAQHAVPKAIESRTHADDQPDRETSPRDGG